MKKQTSKNDDSCTFDHELAGKYLTFFLKNEKYGCPIGFINDIIEMCEVTGVPQTSDYVEGVINLRGTVIPVLDLREKFGMERAEYDRRTCIVVVELDGLQTGLIVDEVEDVIDFADDQVDPAPGMGQQINQRFIGGMGKLEEEVIILLSLEHVLKENELKELKAVEEENSN